MLALIGLHRFSCIGIATGNDPGWGSGAHSETITGEWSHKADDQGQLVWSESADAEIKMTADGFLPDRAIPKNVKGSWVYCTVGKFLFSTYNCTFQASCGELH